jgi:integrase
VGLGALVLKVDGDAEKAIGVFARSGLAYGRKDEPACSGHNLRFQIRRGSSGWGQTGRRRTPGKGIIDSCEVFEELKSSLVSWCCHARRKTLTHGGECADGLPLQVLLVERSGYVTEAGTPVTTAWFLRMVQRTGEAAKLPFPVHPHMLRHSTGYKLANQGEDTRSLAHYLGHRNLQSTAPIQR